MARKAVQAFGKAGGAGAAAAGAAESGEQENPDPGAKERAVLIGGPGSDTPAFQPVKYGDRTFSTQKELTGYLDELNNTRTSLEKKVRDRTEAPPAAVTPTAAATLPDFITDDDLKGIAEEDFLTKPKEVITGLLKKVGQNVEKRLTTQYQAQRTMEVWWDGFFEQNKDLKKHKNIVQMVFQANGQELGTLKMGDASERLAELTRDTILQVGGGKPAREDKPEQRAVVEGAGGKAPAAAVVPAEPQFRTLTGALKARQQARRKAHVA